MALYIAYPLFAIDLQTGQAPPPNALSISGQSKIEHVINVISIGVLGYSGSTVTPTYTDIISTGNLSLAGSSIQIFDLLNISSGALEISGSATVVYSNEQRSKGRIAFFGQTKASFVLGPPPTIGKMFELARPESVGITQARIITKSVDEIITPFLEEKINIKSKDSESLFMKDRESNLNFPIAIKGMSVEPGLFNTFFSASSKDIEILDNSLDKLDTEINIARTELKNKSQDVQIGIKKASGLLDTFALYAGLLNPNIQGIIERYKSTDDVFVDPDNTLFINTSEGILTLPQSKIVEMDLSEANISLSPSSNGTFVEDHDLNKIFDDDDISYMHYLQEGGSDQLSLQFDINLTSASIINNLKILPNNLGFQNWLLLEELSISADGEKWIPVITDPIELQSKNNKYSQKFSFTFVPQKVSKIRCRITQLNKDFNNNYNIGISSFEANKITYGDTGSIIINKKIPTSKINSLSLHLDNSLYDQIALKMDFQVSLNGLIWNDIQPIRDDGPTTEILYINQPWFSESITLETKEFSNIYLKIFFKKVFITDAIIDIVGNDSFGQTEFLEFPTKAPYQITLSESAKTDSINVELISQLAAGKRDLNFLLLGQTEKEKSQYQFSLPFDPKGLDEVFIGDIKLPKIASLGGIHDLYQKGYFIDSDKLKLYINLDDKVAESPRDKFVDPWIDTTRPIPPVNPPENIILPPVNSPGGNGGGGEIIPAPTPVPAVIPDPVIVDIGQIDTPQDFWDDQPIRLFFKHDLISSSSNIIELTHSSDAIKDNIKIWRVRVDENGDTIQEAIMDLIEAGKTVIKLTSIPIIEKTIFLEGGYQVDYIDGVTEFEHSSDYAFSIDFNDGYVHLRDSYSVDVTLQYTRFLEFPVEAADFDVHADGKKITIRPYAFDPGSLYKIEYHIVLEVLPSKYTVDIDGKVIKLLPKTVIEDFKGLNSISGKLLKVSYLFKQKGSSTLQNIFNHLTPIMPEFTIIYSIETL